jgi:hypothetical protein
MRGRVRAAERVGFAMAAAALLAAGCSSMQGSVAARPLTPIGKGEIRSIAVLPFTTAGLARDDSGEPLPEPPGDTVTHAVSAAMHTHGDWQLTDELTVGEAMRRSYGEVRAPTPAEAQNVGKLLQVDAVLRGDVRVFDERIGTELAAKRPAHVIFGVELVRVSDGQPVWQAQYAEQQQALSENLWNLPGFVRAGGTWVRAGELAQIGADRVVTSLHSALYGPPLRKARGKRR